MPQRPVDAVVFDLDGTLVDTLGALPRVYAAAIREIGGREVAEDEIVATWHMGPSPVLLGHFLEDASLVPAALECFYDELATAMARVRLFPGIDDLLTELRASGVSVGVLTNATRRNAEHVMQRAGLDARIDALTTADEVPSKPRPDGLLDLCRRFGVSPGNTLMVGDSWTDLEAADGAGTRSVHAAWTERGRCRLTRPAHHVCVAHPQGMAAIFRP
ncbi:HAD family hydrolase [Jiangella endophytica]|uniref:HAD family hydrolase n=1 Tax=Jiangella endophytica TaxID=1623398 RepID=UPI000E341D1C|nr:HAD-IIIA family hydrolase [Jiangella endophytica]